MGDFLTSVPNLIAGIGEVEAASGEHAEAHVGISFIGLFLYLALVLAIIFGVISTAKKGMTGRIFKGMLANSAEQLFLFIRNMCVGTIGAHGAKYIPFISTLWLVIFFSNAVSLFFPMAPTADLSFNLGLALITVGYVQWEGMKANGVAGHFKHFAGPKLGGPLVLISAMIFVIEIISELMKNVSLSLRLYGNIHGGHEAVEAMNKIGEGAFIPLGSFLLPIKVLTCLVQAMVFTLLTCVYLSLVTHHEDDHHEADGHGADLAHAH